MDRMFGCFMVGYAFAVKQRQRWVYEEMFAPDTSILDAYPAFLTSMEEFTDAFNEYTAMRYKFHPKRWSPFITKEPTVLKTDEVLFPY
jgi:hypothetical protein